MNVTSPAPPSLVGDLMASDPVFVRSDAPLAEAARLMEIHHLHGLPAVDAAGALIGVISQTDLLRVRATEYLWSSWSGLSVRHLMTSPALTVRRDAPLALAARKMERHHVHRLVVVSNEDATLPIGVISATDLVRAMSQAPTTPAPAVDAAADAPSSPGR